MFLEIQNIHKYSCKSTNDSGIGIFQIVYKTTLNQIGNVVQNVQFSCDIAMVFHHENRGLGHFKEHQSTFVKTFSQAEDVIILRHQIN